MGLIYNLGPTWPAAASGQTWNAHILYDRSAFTNNINQARDEGLCFAQLMIKDNPTGINYTAITLNAEGHSVGMDPPASTTVDFYEFEALALPDLPAGTAYALDLDLINFGYHLGRSCPTIWCLDELLEILGITMPVGVEDGGVLTETGLTIYPNPSRGTLHVEWTGTQSGTVDLAVFDALGRRVAERSGVAVPAGPSRLPLSLDVPSGLYLLRLTDNVGTVQARRITVVR